MARFLELLSYFHMSLAMALLTIAAFAVPVQEARADYGDYCGGWAESQCPKDPSTGLIDPTCFNEKAGTCCDSWVMTQCFSTDPNYEQCKTDEKAKCMALASGTLLFNCASDCLNSTCYTRQFCEPLTSCNQNATCLAKCKCYNKSPNPNIYICICTAQ